MSSLGHIARKLFANQRRFFILLLLFVTLFAQSTTLTCEHQQHHETEHCCLFCHGSLLFVRASAPATVAPLTSVTWLAAVPRFESYYDVFLSIGSSRGPPARS